MADIYKDMCIKQGYVPASCIMNGAMCLALVNSEGNPCRGCNADRNVCNGRDDEKNYDR